MPTPTLPKKRSKGTTPHRNLCIKTERGNIRLAIHVTAENLNDKGRKVQGMPTTPPVEVDVTLRTLLGGQTDPITRQPPKATWHDYPPEEGFYVRWARGEGLSEVFYGGEDTLSEYIREGVGVQFFGPFQIPL
jgi:hypothetical protein